MNVSKERIRRSPRYLWHMKVIVLVLALAVVCLSGATHASARQACVPVYAGNTKTFCGPAKGKLIYGVKKVSFNQGGRCAVSDQWTLDLGTFTLIDKPKWSTKYLGITAFGKKAGKHDAAITWQFRGRTHNLARATVTLAPGLKKGTFRGLMSHHRWARGSFTCR